MVYELPYYFNFTSCDLNYYYKPIYLEIIYANYFKFIENSFTECVKCESMENKAIRLIKPAHCFTYLNAIKLSNFSIVFN